jgi:hypothetical protein
LPFKHVEHEVAPVEGTNCPTGHVLHCMDPAAEYLPAPHSWHALTPAVSEYFPAAHGGGVVEDVVSCGVVEDVVGCGVVEDVVGCGMTHGPPIGPP